MEGGWGELVLMLQLLVLLLLRDGGMDLELVLQNLRLYQSLQTMNKRFPCFDPLEQRKPSRRDHPIQPITKHNHWNQGTWGDLHSWGDLLACIPCISPTHNPTYMYTYKNVNCLDWVASHPMSLPIFHVLPLREQI